MSATAADLIAALGLAPLPGEGGYFRVIWRNATASAIAFLLTPEEFSAWHRLAQDELWLFLEGDPVEHLQCDPTTGRRQSVRLGTGRSGGETRHVHVAAGTWQAARLVEARGGYALVACLVSPPWDEAGFELARRESLPAVLAALGETDRTLAR